MKSIKNIFISIVSMVVLSSGSLSASSAPTSFDPVIEISNKDKESIQVNISDATTDAPIATAYVSPNQQWNSGSRAVDFKNKMLVEILKQNKLIGSFMIDAPGKTKYLSWNPAKSPALYPQTGSFMGLSGKSDSGVSLKNNLSSSQIKKQ